MGKSNMYSRTNIASLTTPSPTLLASPNPPTGLAAFSPFLAEDNMIALGLWHQLGLRHAMTSDVALDFISNLTLSGYIARRVRWLRVRKTMTLAATLVEPFTESIVCGIYGSWAISRLLGATRSALFAVHMVLWLTVDLGVKRSLATHVKDIGPPTNTAIFCLAWLCRETLALPIWLWAMLGNEVVWRGTTYKMLASG
jgi:ceramide glucosyltransferase